MGAEQSLLPGFPSADRPAWTPRSKMQFRDAEGCAAAYKD
jgi:hypothetical protein